MVDAIDLPTFEVVAHFEIRGRGAVIQGHVRGGVLRIGMRTDSSPSEDALTIAGIDFVDNLATRESWIGLTFVERPDADSMRARFPVGSLMTFRTTPVGSGSALP